MIIHKAFGLDLGTTNSTASVFKEGFSFCPEDGKLKGVPSIVGEKGGIILVGVSAKNNLGVEKVKSIKRQMGKDITITLGGVNFKPEDISAEIIKFCTKLLNDQIDKPKNTIYDRIVITVPAYFSVAQKDATRRAGELAGLDVVMLLEEPTAAAINYTVKKNIQNGIFMVYDLGGGTFDVSIIEKIDNIPIVLATAGNNFLGGDNFDSILAHYFIDVINNDLGYSIKLDKTKVADERKFKALLFAAENVKKNLSQNDTFTVNYYDVFKDNSGVDLLIENFTREKFEELIKEKIKIDTIAECEKALDVFSATGRSANEIDAILLVGGSSKMQIVVKTLEEQYVNKGIISKIVTDEPDLAVGLGAGIVAAAKPTIIADVALGIKVEVNAPFLHEGSLIISGKVITGGVDEIGIIVDGKETRANIGNKKEFSAHVGVSVDDLQYNFYILDEIVSGVSLAAEDTNLISPMAILNETIRIEIVDLDRREVIDYPLAEKGEALPLNTSHHFKINEFSQEKIILPIKEGYREIFAINIEVPEGTPIGSRLTVRTEIDVLGEIKLDILLNGKEPMSQIKRSSFVDIDTSPDEIRDEFYEKISNVKDWAVKDKLIACQENIERELKEAQRNNEPVHYTDVVGKYESLVRELPREVLELSEEDFEMLGNELKKLSDSESSITSQDIDDEVYFGKRALSRNDITDAKERYENLQRMNNVLEITAQPKFLLALMIEQTISIIEEAEAILPSINDPVLQKQISEELITANLGLNTLDIKSLDLITDAEAKELTSEIIQKTRPLFFLLEKTGIKEIKDKLEQFRGRVSRD